ncbi:MAG: UTP--glucose-1-phosphate uridylyltransferase [Planctomycetaceae bacterium]|nr:UTP--glucose-1-phosphate uridylyltransferase [Planctomycetaceae bacterium]
MPSSIGLSQSVIRQKMEAADVPQPAIAAFLDAVTRLNHGESGLLAEHDVVPVDDVFDYSDLSSPSSQTSSLLAHVCVIKLNGGLGTGMGLSGPKSLLRVRGDETFLDFIARQVLKHRDASGTQRPVFLLMNSFVTRDASLRYLTKYPRLANHDGSLDFVQNRVPKLDTETLEPVKWPTAPELEWCPPGHGDLYPSLLGNGDLLERLLESGLRYLFVSNADNLGATIDPRILEYFAESNLSFLMEVAARTEVDRKGGHLTRRRLDGRLVLRESVQCPAEDMPHFQDILRHRFFNTNNLWIQLEHLRAALAEHGGALPLPLIQNRKPIDPQQPHSPVVLQLESAMGAAIECFDHSGAILVPRDRFAPVKTTSDLLGVQSDAYEVHDDGTILRLVESRRGQPPLIDLDAAHYKLLGRFHELFAAGPPSLVDCRSLRVTGPVRFAHEIGIRGDVSIVNDSPVERALPSGNYADETITL